MIEIFILSFIQGVTEFLPVSSSSHLIILSNYINFENQSLSIDVSLHIGSFLAVITFFRNDIITLSKIRSFFKNNSFIIACNDNWFFSCSIKPYRKIEKYRSNWLDYIGIWNNPIH